MYYVLNSLTPKNIDVIKNNLPTNLMTVLWKIINILAFVNCADFSSYLKSIHICASEFIKN